MTPNRVCPRCKSYNPPRRTQCWQCGNPLTITNSRGTSMSEDIEHLKLLSIFHYVVAGLTALFACFPVIHLSIGISMLSSSLSANSSTSGPLPLFGLIFVIIPAILILLGWAFAFCIFLAGRYLAGRRHRLFCLIIAGINCAFAPLGTVLGVFTIVVLMRPSIKDLFGR